MILLLKCYTIYIHYGAKLESIFSLKLWDFQLTEHYSPSECSKTLGSSYRNAP